MATLVNVIPTFQVNTGTAATGGQFSPQIVGLSNGNILVAWQEGSDGAIATAVGVDIVGKIFDSQGNLVRDAFRINFSRAVDDEYDFDIAATNDGGFIMVYRDDDISNPDQDSIHWERFIDGGSAIRQREIAIETIAANAFFNPRVAVDLTDNSSVVTFTDRVSVNDDVRAVVLNASGTITAAEFDAAQNSADRDADADVAILSNGNYVSVYEETDAGTVAIEARVFTPAGAAIFSFAQVAASAGQNPRVAGLSDGNFVVVWRATTVNNGDIVGKIYAPTGNAVSAQFNIAATLGFENEADVHALPTGGFVVIWDNDSVNTIEAQAFTASGAPDGAMVTISALAFGNEPDVEVAADGRVLFTWKDGEIQAAVWDPRASTVNASDYTGTETNFVNNTGPVTAPVNGTLSGTESGDTLAGSTGRETLNGNGGDDRILFTEASPFDNVDGGGNTDTIDASGVTSRALVIDLASETISDGATTLFVRNVENVIGTQTGDTLTGNSASNALTGGLGNDTLAGGLGDDTYVYGLGDGQDTITDSGGRDTMDVNGISVDDMILVVDNQDQLFGVFGSGNDIVRFTDAVNNANARTDLLLFDDGNIVDLGGIIGGQNFDDNANSFDGTDNSEFHNMRGGDDTVRAFGNNDIVVAGAGNDTIAGGTGIDQLYGGTGNDIYQYWAGDGLDRIVDIQGQDELRFQSGIVVDDLIMVVRNADLIISFFGAGSDVIEMANAVTTPAARVDVLRFLDGTALDLGGIVGGQNFDDTQNVVIGRNDSDFTNARGGNDVVFGNAGNDIILGGAGNDSIDGGTGLDVLRGGADADTFQFTASGGAADADLILDFQSGVDTIALSSSVFSALSPGSLPLGTLVYGTAALDANDRLIYDTGTGQLFYDADGTGGTAAIKFAELQGGVTLLETDFLIV